MNFQLEDFIWDMEMKQSTGGKKANDKYAKLLAALK